MMWRTVRVVRIWATSPVILPTGLGLLLAIDLASRLMERQSWHRHGLYLWLEAADHRLYRFLDRNVLSLCGHRETSD